MKTISAEELKQILENHKHWLNEDCEGWQNMRADLHNANLYNADLYNADLCDANLSYANLHNANLSYANLSNADLHNANLRNANLSNANLSNADLYNANLSNANLYNANLSYANLRYADLCDANLSYADLYNANLRYAKNVPYIPMVCPEEDEFIGWKKASNKIIKLKIPKDALRSSATTRKCRCNKAKVLEIYNLDGTVAEEREVRSSYDKDFIYTVGKTVKVKDFDTDRWKECSTGIHFFMQRQEAINY